MEWNNYKERFILKAKQANKNDKYIEKWLSYANNLFSKQLPIIYDQNHLCLLLGFSKNYVYAASNAQKYFYREFKIPKKNGEYRVINEPLPNLKEIQKWILENILYKIEISIYAKAYRKGYSLKDNVKFHRNQKKVLSLDIESFFDNLKYYKILNVFSNIGYANDVSIMLANLCSLNSCLPQGAPTSACLSNIIMKEFDDTISSFCKERHIRYTRYADDMTFSGDFNEIEVIEIVRKKLKEMNLNLNKNKIRVRIQGQQQLVTGLVVNKTIQLPKKTRKELRKSIYYIKKFGFSEHVRFIEEDRSNYLNHLIGIVGFGLYINPKDKELMSYKSYLLNLKSDYFS